MVLVNIAVVVFSPVYSVQRSETRVCVHHPSAEADHRRGGGDGRLQDHHQAPREERDGALSQPVHPESRPARSPHTHHELKPGRHPLL